MSSNGHGLTETPGQPPESGQPHATVGTPTEVNVGNGVAPVLQQPQHPVQVAPPSQQSLSETGGTPMKMINKNFANMLNGHKRPVARRACLSCREKKIKCDGEPPIPPGITDVQTPRICSNCRFSGSECVFVRSNRGGRRRKRSGSFGESVASEQSKLPKQETSSITSPRSSSSSSQLASSTTNASTANSSFAPPTRNQIDFLHSNTRENGAPQDRSGRRSPSLESQSTGSFYRDFRPEMYGGRRSPPSPDYRHHHGQFPAPDRVEDHGQQFARGMGGGPGGGPGGPGGDGGAYGMPLTPHGGPGPGHHGGPYGPPHFGGRGFGYGGPHHRGPHHGGGGPGGGGGGPFGMRGGGHDHFGYGPPPHAFHHHRGKKWHHMWDHYQLPPPQALLSHQQPQYSDRSSVASGSAVSGVPNEPQNRGAAALAAGGAAAEAERTNSLSSSTMSVDQRQAAASGATGTAAQADSSQSELAAADKVLAEHDLPGTRTCEVLFDLYYRYIHPSFPVLYDKTTFISLYSARAHASLLHCMFAIVCEYAPVHVIPAAIHRDRAHWIQFVEKYWANLDTVSSACTLLLLFRYFVTLGDFAAAQHSLSRLNDLIEINDWQIALRHRDRAYYDKLHQLSTRRALDDRLHMTAILWAAWRCQLYFRTTIQSVSPAQLPHWKFPSELELPSQRFTVPVLSWADTVAQSSNEDYLVKLDDSQFAIMIDYMVDEFEKLTHSIDKADFNSKVDKLTSITERKLYKITSLQSSSIILDKKVVVVNAHALNSLLQLTLLKTANNLLELSNWLLFKPVNFSDKLSEDLKPAFDISRTPEILVKGFDVFHLKALLKVFNASVQTIKILNLGYGIIAEDNGNYPVVLGPTTYKSSAEIRGHLDSLLNSEESGTSEPWWSKFDDSNSVTAVRDQDVPDLWPAYPMVTVQLVSKTLCILASVTLLCKFMVFENTDQQLVAKIFDKPLSQAENDVYLTNQTILKDPAKVVAIDVNNPDFESVRLTEFSLSHLAAALRICYKFLRSQSRYSPALERNLVQIDNVVKYVDEFLQEYG